VELRSVGLDGIESDDDLWLDASAERAWSWIEIGPTQHALATGMRVGYAPLQLAELVGIRFDDCEPLP
jgi:hypothetical protein